MQTAASSTRVSGFSGAALKSVRLTVRTLMGDTTATVALAVPSVVAVSGHC